MSRRTPATTWWERSSPLRHPDIAVPIDCRQRDAGLQRDRPVGLARVDTPVDVLDLRPAQLARATLRISGPLGRAHRACPVAVTSTARLATGAMGRQFAGSFEFRDDRSDVVVMRPDTAADLAHAEPLACKALHLDDLVQWKIGVGLRGRHQVTRRGRSERDPHRPCGLPRRAGEFLRLLTSARR